MQSICKIFLVTAGLLVVLLSACAPHFVPMVKKNPAAEYYRMGMFSLKEDSLKTAAQEFHAAVKSDSTYAPAWAGLGYILGIFGKYDLGLKYINKSIRITPSADAYAFKGRFFLHSQKPDGWAEKAAEAFDRALDLEPYHPDALFFKSQLFKRSGNLEGAISLLKTLNSLKDIKYPQSDSMLSSLLSIKQENPETPTGIKIALRDSVTRAGLAALLDIEIQLVKKLEKNRPVPFQGFVSQSLTGGDTALTITDIEGHWAEISVRRMVYADVFDVYPDDTFRPEKKVKRRDAALVFQNVLVQYFGEQIATRYVNRPSDFVDIDRDHYAYNAINLVSELEIMTFKRDVQQFSPNEPLDGFDALRAVHQLRSVLDSL